MRPVGKWSLGLMLQLWLSSSRIVTCSGELTSSARNKLNGLVTKIVSDKVMSQIELQCGPFRLVSLISTEAVQELGLEVGSPAIATVKATNVIIETTGLSS